METYSPVDAAEHFLALFAPDLDGARSALEICSITQSILRDRVADLEQEQDSNSKEAAGSLQEESRIIKCGPYLLLHVCSFLRIKEKVRFRYSSLGLHSMLLGCAIDLTESNEVRELATTDFVLGRLVPLRKFSNRNQVHEACSCSVAVWTASIINDLKLGSFLSLAEQFNAPHPNKAKKLKSIGFGCSWSVVGLSLLQESDAEMLPKLLRAIRPNQITKIAIGSTSTGILTAIGQAAEVGKLKGLEQIDFYKNFDTSSSDDDDDELDSGNLGTLSSFGPGFHTLILHESQIVDISGLETCKSLRTLYLGSTQVTDVSVLASCSSLHTLFLFNTQVADVSALGSCNSLHTLDLCNTQVVDVSALRSCSSLHTLNLGGTQVADVSALGSCGSLHSLNLSGTQVADVATLGSCSSLHTLNLNNTQVTDVSPLGLCRSLHTMYLYKTQVVDVSALSCLSIRYRLTEFQRWEIRNSNSN